ncbi:MAG TPA: Dabb family protein [Tepidisphaeraceae bacterium]|nr:Dabb family protein [Tepidisphaeraceae bacterium]
MFIHTVYFWLTPAATDEIRQKLLTDCANLLGKIPSARHVWVGRPAMTPREVVDNTYDVGLCTVFDDAAGHDEYQVHPLHKEFIARNKEYWKRVQIYDFR